ncbi:MAG TPA: glycosyltransferase family 4 protein, partial [Candidatus Bilamarchaeaceae archaeon]|nr:glycosyltransferase family 4 protein [Candidatus Bilamarchaeaceae archaeon]
ANSLGVKRHCSEAPYDEIHRIYQNSAAIVLPSKYEGFSLVWLEAMASGRPMFSTPVGDGPALFEQAYGKNAEDFLFNSEEELIKKLTNYLKDPLKHRKTIERAEYIVKEEYSWENVARLTLNAYQDSLTR